MDQDLEDELLMHVAAGTDLPTALAALPQSEPTTQTSEKPGWIVWAILIGVVIMVWLAL